MILKFLLELSKTFSDAGKIKIASKVRIERADNDNEKQYLLEGKWTEFARYPNLIFAQTNEHVQKVDCRKLLMEGR